MAHIAVERRSIASEKWAKTIFEKVNNSIFKHRFIIDGWKVRNAQYSPQGYQWEDDGYSTIDEGDLWGGPDVTSVFQCDFTIPDSLDGEEIWFYQLTSTEVIVSENGRYLDGLDPNRAWLKLNDCAKGGQKHAIMLEAYTRSKPDDDRSMNTYQLKGCIQHFKRPELVVIDHEMLSLKYDLDMIFQSAYASYMDEDTKSYLQRHVEELVKLFPLYDSGVEELKEALPTIQSYIQQKIYNANQLFGKIGRLACVAHSHLDIAYHWKVGQTVQKNARTTLIQLRLMERYPEFKYAHTQAWTYESLEEYYPEIFEELKGKIAEGQWEIVGGMYVEPDCNLISAESMARQIIYGKQYFLEKFNIDVDNCWLPDVFGNSPIMPQILKKGGINYFVSNKMSTWNDTNLFPYNNFIWRGLDGTDIFACVPPVHFITWMEPNQAIENWARYQNKDICPESLQMFGYGDGGSGVTEEMIEYFERQNKLPGIPEMRMTTGKEYLHSAFENAEPFPVWDGDLYLEMHRGTFTTKGLLKRYNRKGEFLAQETETICAIASLESTPGYPTQEEIKKPWKILLLNQFHDILPGSHTAPVTDDAIEAYEKMNADFNHLKKRALECITEQGDQNDFVIMNLLSDIRGGVALGCDLPENVQSLQDADGNLYPIQKLAKEQEEDAYCCIIPEIEGFGTLKLTASTHIVDNSSNDMRIGKNSMENQFFKLDIDDMGCITSIYDKKRGRNISAKGAVSNEWQIFDDRPGIYNAWDIVKNYKDMQIEISPWSSIEIVETGPITIALRLERAFGKSRASQIIRMYQNKPRIDFETWVDWHEDQKLLKVAFPVNVKSRMYTVDTSAGVLERMNNQNTTWEQARFEVPCHKWVNISEGLFGVALMNDCKYGCDVSENVIRLSLLRAPIRPDRESDRGKHYFTYSLFTHSGDWQRDGLVEEAYDLNYPLKLTQGRTLPTDSKMPPIKINNSAIKCQAFKQSEDGSGDLVLRIVELYGSHAETTMDIGFGFKKAVLCDLLERETAELTSSQGKLKIAVNPYEIATIRFYR